MTTLKRMISFCVVALMVAAFPQAPASAYTSGLKQCPKSGPKRFYNCQGTNTFSSGSKYVGEFQNGKRNGRGTFFFASGNKYVGEFKDDDFSGQGTFTFKAGDSYTGGFLKGKRDGYGTFKFPSGTVYVGESKQDKFHGQGTMTFANGNSYTGAFANGKRNGYGVFSFTSGNRHVGQNLDDKFHGPGRFTYADGDKYVGEFVNGLRNGQGIFTFKTGWKYVGTFKNDKYDGQGTLFQPSGTISERGIFRADKLVQPNDIDQQVAIAPQPKPKPVVKAVPVEPKKKAPVINTNERRVALVIGNGAYQKAPPLTNPKNDASAMSSMLTGMGFTVFTGIDMNRREMALKISDFLREAQQADVSLVFYAGHGIQVAGQNYLVPVDAEVGVPSAVDFELINVSSISSYMGGQNTIGIILLDACRDNPFTRSLARSLGTRSSQVGNGLAPIASQGGGLLVGFATAPGDVAADGRGANSPFTTGLLKHLPTPGLEIELALKRVKATVVGMTKNQQRPWHNSDLSKEVYLTSN